jgi:hypothetical protein
MIFNDRKITSLMLTPTEEKYLEKSDPSAALITTDSHKHCRFRLIKAAHEG